MSTMMENEAKKSSAISLSDFLKTRFLDVIYAKSDGSASGCLAPAPASPAALPTCPDKAGGGDAPAVTKVCVCPAPDTSKFSAGDRGKTGAGVTGTRSGSISSPCKDGASDADELPEGAKNPGLLRHIHNAARFRLPQCFEGATVSLKQNSSSNWVLGHSLAFSSVSPGGYKLLLSYADRTRLTGIPYFVMEAAPGGQVSCEFRVGPSKGTRATVVTQIADAEFYSFESIFDAYFSNFTASVIAVNREFIALHYLQVIF